MTYIKHPLPEMLLRSPYPVTVNVIGCGGTGWHLLHKLAMLHVALVKSNRNGLSVCAYDADTVSENNVPRQFNNNFLNINKAVAACYSVNSQFGTHFTAVPNFYEFKNTEKVKTSMANITITCTDTVQSRLQAKAMFSDQNITQNKYTTDVAYRPVYWLDIGNEKTHGQAILGTVATQTTMHDLIRLPDVIDTFGEKYGSKQESSLLPAEAPRQADGGCTFIDSLSAQSLFVNDIMAALAVNLLNDLLFKTYLEFCGIFVNLSTGNAVWKTISQPK